MKKKYIICLATWNIERFSNNNQRTLNELTNTEIISFAVQDQDDCNNYCWSDGICNSGQKTGKGIENLLKDMINSFPPDLPIILHADTIRHNS